MRDDFLLSVCIPTYNRCERVVEIVRHLLTMPDSERVQVCVHVDGSSDGTLSALQEIADRRIKVSFDENKGQGYALRRAIGLADGKYLVLINDDDMLEACGLSSILKDCSGSLDQGVCGFIYHLVGDDGHVIGTPFPQPKSNFIKLRADESVKGDKEEVVLTSIAKDVVRKISTNERRIPPSLIWSSIALNYDVICRDVSVGNKSYLDGGITKNINKVKRQNPISMQQLYGVHMRGYFSGRYASYRFLMKAIMLYFYYGVLAVKKKRVGARVA